MRAWKYCSSSLQLMKLKTFDSNPNNNEHFALSTLIYKTKATRYFAPKK